MNQLMSSFMEVNLPYISLLIGVVTSLMLYVVTLYQVQKLRCTLAFYRQRVEGLEGQLSAALGGKALPWRAETPAAGAVAGAAEAREAVVRGGTPQATQRKVLHLHGLGLSSVEIAREAGIREAEVNFVLKVSEHTAESGGSVALRKIS
jgi:hypothetical protein